jgi:hypothetical protein
LIIRTKTITEICDDNGERIVDPVESAWHRANVNIAIVAGVIMPYDHQEVYEPGDTVLSEGDTYVCVASHRIMGVTPGGSSLWRRTTSGVNAPVPAKVTQPVKEAPQETPQAATTGNDAQSRLNALRGAPVAPSVGGAIEHIVDEDQLADMKLLYPEMLGDPRRQTQQQVALPDRDATGAITFRRERRAATATQAATHAEGETPSLGDDNIDFGNVQRMG